MISRKRWSGTYTRQSQRTGFCKSTSKNRLDGYTKCGEGGRRDGPHAEASFKDVAIVARARLRQGLEEKTRRCASRSRLVRSHRRGLPEISRRRTSAIILADGSAHPQGYAHRSRGHALARNVPRLDASRRPATAKDTKGSIMHISCCAGSASMPRENGWR